MNVHETRNPTGDPPSRISTVRYVGGTLALAQLPVKPAPVQVRGPMAANHLGGGPIPARNPGMSPSPDRAGGARRFRLPLLFQSPPAAAGGARGGVAGSGDLLDP